MAPLIFKDQFTPLYGLNFLVITQQGRKLNSIVNAYNKQVSAVTATDIDVLINSAETIPLKHNKISSLLFILENFGYYISDEQYNTQTDFFFQYALHWCSDSQGNVNMGDRILKAVIKNIGRMNNEKVAELLVSFFENNLRRFYDEVLRILFRLDLKKVNEMVKNKIMKHCIILIREENFGDASALKNTIITIRKNISKNADLLDDTVRKYMPEFYSKEYDLEINKTNIIRAC